MLNMRWKDTRVEICYRMLETWNQSPKGVGIRTGFTNQFQRGTFKALR
jgi:hypothetical protein